MDSRINTAVMDEIMRVGAEMQDQELVNTFEGNLSIKDGDLMYITPSRTSKKALTYDNICVFDLSTFDFSKPVKDQKIWGTGKPSSETLSFIEFTPPPTTLITAGLELMQRSCAIWS